MTSESDDDFIVVFEGPSREDACPTIDAVAELLGGRASGSEEIFGKQVWLDDLRGRIGRDEDGNANLTRRMLFVLESVPVRGDATHARALMGLLSGDSAAASTPSSVSCLFARVAELGREFEGGLLALLFDDPELRRRMREYIVF